MVFAECLDSKIKIDLFQCDFIFMEFWISGYMGGPLHNHEVVFHIQSYECETSRHDPDMFC